MLTTPSAADFRLQPARHIFSHIIVNATHETDKQTDRRTEIERKRDRDRESQRETERDRDRGRQTETERSNRDRPRDQIKKPEKRVGLGGRCWRGAGGDRF